MPLQLFTIGVYGTDEATFFDALSRHRITHFVDVRALRGLRGGEYRYANAAALQRRLEEMGIAYQHRKDLAPDAETRRLQALKDKEAGIARRERSSVSEEFRRLYRERVLRNFDPEAFVAAFPNSARVALFCVEAKPEACHRSLLAGAIARALGIRWRDITPAAN